jgi:hypothetical protein
MRRSYLARLTQALSLLGEILKIDFEKQHFQQSCYWVGELIFNIMKSELKLSLIANPETSIIDGTIIFYGVEEYSGEFDLQEYDSDCTENLIGIDAIGYDNKTKYVINFGIGEVIFSTAIKPEVKWKNQNKINTYKPNDERIIIET